MHPLIKMLGGVLLMLISVAAVAYSHLMTEKPYWLPDLWEYFVTVVLGVLPALVFVIGLFIAWLEWDEWRIEKELAREEKEEEERRRGRRGRRRKE